MRRIRVPHLVVMVAGLAFAWQALADVSLTDKKAFSKQSRAAVGPGKLIKSGPKPYAKLTTGAKVLIDNSGLKFFINTNITFNTTSSASGAASEASYTHAVAADTLGGGVVNATLSDAFDGYNTLCLSLNGTVANCATGNANFVIYNKLGPATTECPGLSGLARQVVFPTMTSGNVQVSRKVYVPDNDSFMRHLNIFKNIGVSSTTVTAVIANNLGSDSATKIVTTSSGDAVVTTADTWVTSFQNWSGTTSPDVRLGHVLQGAGASVGLAGINFVDLDDNPFWGYTMTLAPGETKIIANYAIGAPTRAAAAANAERISHLPATATTCMTGAEIAALVNLAPTSAIPAAGTTGLVVLGVALALAGMQLVRKLG